MAENLQYAIVVQSMLRRARGECVCVRSSTEHAVITRASGPTIARAMYSSGKSVVHSATYVLSVVLMQTHKQSYERQPVHDLLLELRLASIASFAFAVVCIGIGAALGTARITHAFAMHQKLRARSNGRHTCISDASKTAHTQQ